MSLLLRTYTQSVNLAQVTSITTPYARPWYNASSQAFAEYGGSTSWLGKALDDANELMKLKSDWDLQGGQPITREAYDSALWLLSTFSVVISAKPTVMPLDYGGLLIEWSNLGARNRELQFEVNPSGTIEFNVNEGDNVIMESSIARANLVSVRTVLDPLLSAA